MIREITLLEAIREALRNELRKDQSVFLMGEGIGPRGSAFNQTAGLWEEFGDARVRDTPISESAFTGAGVGAAVCGMRPVVDLMFLDFSLVAMDQIVNMAAKLRWMSKDQLSVPLVIRASCGTLQGSLNALGPHHGQSFYSWFVHTPGIKVVLPSTPYDAKGLLISAIRDNDPVIYLEHKGLFKVKGPVPEEEYVVPLGEAEIRRTGSDVTVIATGLMVHYALDAANELQEDGISLEIIDPRTLWPIDRGAIVESVRRTGHLVIVDEGYSPCGFSAEIAAMITDDAFRYLRAPIKRINAHHVPIPFSPLMANFVIPNKERIVQAVKHSVQEKRTYA